MPARPPTPPTGSGETALITASRSGNLDAVKLLLDHGAPVNAWDTQAGQTALMWAIREHHSDVVQLLLSRGADVKARTKVVVDFPPETGNLEGVGRAQNLPKGVTPGGMTPLLYAAREGTLDVARMLVAAGADVNVAEANQTSPLLVAILNDHIDVANFLLDHGANVNAADGFGRTPLWSAVDYRNLDTPDKTETDRGPMLELIRALLDHGADPNAAIEGRAAQPPLDVRIRGEPVGKPGGSDAAPARGSGRRRRQHASADGQGRRSESQVSCGRHTVDGSRRNGLGSQPDLYGIRRVGAGGGEALRGKRRRCERGDLGWESPPYTPPPTVD